MTSEKKRPGRPLTRFDVEASAAMAKEILAQAKVSGVVIGTINSNSYFSEDEELATKDLDLAVKQEDIVWVENVLRERGIPFAQVDIGGVQVKLRSQAIHLDFVDRHTSPQVMAVFREAIDATKETIEIGRVEIPAAPIEYVIAMKLATARRKDDLIVQTLLRDPEIDKTRVLDIVTRHYGDVGANRLRALAASVGATI